MSTNYDSMTASQLEAHILHLTTEHKEDVKALRALLRVKQRDEGKLVTAALEESTN